MNDEQRLLASAALDDAVTSEERARAEADPEIVAEIERLRAVRAALPVDVAPDAGRREDSIAAALAVFEATPPPPSLAARRRSRWMAPLTAAAAVVAIAVSAVVVMRGGGGGGDDTATEIQSVAPAAAADTASAGVESESVPVVAPDAAEEGDILAEAPADDASEATQPELTEAVTTLRSPADLADFAGRTSGVERAAGAADAVCAIGTPLGTAYYVVTGTAVLVEVYEIADPHEAVAADVDGCAIIARVALP